VAEGGGPLASFNHQAIPAKAEAEGYTEELEISLKARRGRRVGRGSAGPGFKLRENKHGDYYAKDKGSKALIKVATAEAGSFFGDELAEPGKKHPGQNPKQHAANFQNEFKGH